jgi:hypothetical protein
LAVKSPRNENKTIHLNKNKRRHRTDRGAKATLKTNANLMVLSTATSCSVAWKPVAIARHSKVQGIFKIFSGKFVTPRVIHFEVKNRKQKQFTGTERSLFFPPTNNGIERVGTKTDTAQIIC